MPFLKKKNVCIPAFSFVSKSLCLQFTVKGKVGTPDTCSKVSDV